MPFMDFPDRSRSIQVPNWVLVLLFLAYALPGNIGHLPWRGDDIQHISISRDLLESGGWLAPKLAGLTYTEWGPLTYWIGAATGKLLSWFLPIHDAIRSCTILALGALVWFLRASAREFYGQEAGAAAVLLTLGSLGLLLHAHEMQPQMVLSACMAASLYGVARIHSQPGSGALITGTASGAAFLAAGLAGLILTLPLCVCAFVYYREHRRKIAIGLLPLIFLTLCWPLLLAVQDPAYLAAWWASQISKILPHGEHLQRFRSLGNLIGWFAWPLWPVAIWSLWHRRGQYQAFGHVLPIVATGLSLALISTTGAMKPANVLPLLPPLILIAAAETCRLRRGAANAFDWFGVMTFSLLGLFLWLAWSGLSHGWPPALARNVSRLMPDFQASWSWLELCIAIVLSLAWVTSIIKVPFFQLRGALHWALGITLSWGLATTLWLSWFDHDRNYKPASSKIAAAISAQQKQEKTCVAGKNIGDSLRAGLRYFDGIELDTAADAESRCGLLLSFAARKRDLPQLASVWIPILDLGEGRSRFQEKFALYRKAADKKPAQ